MKNLTHIALWWAQDMNGISVWDLYRVRFLIHFRHLKVHHVPAMQYIGNAKSCVVHRPAIQNSHPWYKFKKQRNDVTNIKSNIKTMLSRSYYVLTKKMLLPADLFSLTTSCQVLVKQTKSGLEELQQSSPESFHNTFEVFWELPYRHLLV